MSGNKGSSTSSLEIGDETRTRLQVKGIYTLSGILRLVLEHQEFVKWVDVIGHLEALDARPYRQIDDFVVWVAKYMPHLSCNGFVDIHVINEIFYAVGLDLPKNWKLSDDP